MKKVIKDEKESVFLDRLIGSYRYVRIKKDFCDNCKYKCKSACDCPRMQYGDGVCSGFTWVSLAQKEKFEVEVLENQAVTRWLDTRNKSLDEIYKMSNKELLSILTKAQLNQFQDKKPAAKDFEKSVETRLSDLVIPEELLVSIQEVDKEETNTKCIEQSVTNNPLDNTAPVQYFDLLGNPIIKKGDKRTVITPHSPLPKTVDTARRGAEATPKKEAQVGIHYFYCKEPDGKEVTYKRKLESKTYETEVASFRKHLAKENIEIVREDIVLDEQSVTDVPETANFAAADAVSGNVVNEKVSEANKDIKKDIEESVTVHQKVAELPSEAIEK